MPPRLPINPGKRKERYQEAVSNKMAKLYAYGEAKPSQAKPSSLPDLEIP